MRKLTLYLTLSLIVVFSGMSIITYKSSLETVPTAAYNVGSSGSIVKDLEERLKWLGLFKGTPDTHYGYDTFEAVKRVQKDRGLKVDGIAGDKTLATLGISVSKDKDSNDTKPSDKENNSDVTQKDQVLLARTINGEARGEPYEGQVAVGAVIMNRIADSRFPNNIPGVIYEPGAFTCVQDGQINAALEETPKRAANDAMNGWDPSGGCVFYYNPKTATNKWIKTRPIVKTIGKHVFTK